MAGVVVSRSPRCADPAHLLGLEQAWLHARHRLPAGMALPLISWLRADWRRRHGVPELKMGARKPVLFDPAELDSWTQRYLCGETGPLPEELAVPLASRRPQAALDPEHTTTPEDGNSGVAISERTTRDAARDAPTVPS